VLMFKIELVIFFGGWAPPFLVALEVVHESFLVRGRMPTKEWWLGSNVVFSSFFFFFLTLISFNFALFCSKLKCVLLFCFYIKFNFYFFYCYFLFWVFFLIYPLMLEWLGNELHNFFMGLLGLMTWVISLKS
jgi:hypothetical protein